MTSASGACAGIVDDGIENGTDVPSWTTSLLPALKVWPPREMTDPGSSVWVPSTIPPANPEETTAVEVPIVITARGVEAEFDVSVARLTVLPSCMMPPNATL